MGMTWAMRMEAGGVIGLATVGLMFGAAAMVGIVPANPPATLAPAVAVLAGTLALLKAGVIAVAFVRYALSRI